MTTIEYSRNPDGTAGESWNPIVGCNPVSRGCRGCWAARQAHRGLSSTHRGLTVLTEHGARWNGKVKTFAEVLDHPLHWKRPRTIVTAFMSDPFYHEVPFEFLAAMFAVMAACPQHTFIMLTKRDPLPFFKWLDGPDSDRTYPAHVDLLHRYLTQLLGKSAPRAQAMDWPLPNVVLGVSVENQDSLYRVKFLRERLAATQVISFGPLVGSVQIPDWTSIDGILVEGESGPDAEPMHPQWVRSLREQAQRAGRPFFFKGWGRWAPYLPKDETTIPHQKAASRRLWLNTEGETGHAWIYDDGSWLDLDAAQDPECVAAFTETGKKRSGRILDGSTYDALPWGCT